MNFIKIFQECAFATRALQMLTFNCKSTSISTQVSYFLSGGKSALFGRFGIFWIFLEFDSDFVI